MGRADEIRRSEGSADAQQYACGNCGVPLGDRYDACPECDSTAIVELDEILDSEFRA